MINLDKTEYDELLLHDFPELYERMNMTVQESCLGFGTEINKGWYEIIYYYSEKIHDYMKEKNLNTRVEQVKQKFGELRWYIDNTDDFIDKLVNKAENECEKICEVCGSREEVKNTRYITICNKCKKENGI